VALAGGMLSFLAIVFTIGIFQVAGLSWVTLGAVGFVVILLLLETTLFRQLRRARNDHRSHRYSR
jgi:hypothetical protein